MLKSTRKIFDTVIVDTVRMNEGDQLEWIIGDPAVARAKPPNGIRLLVGGSIRLQIGNDFLVVLTSGQSTNYRPRKDMESYPPELAVTYTALEDSIYICASKEGAIVTESFITVPDTGLLVVPASTIIIPTAITVINDITIQPGDSYWTNEQITITSVPNSTIAIAQFT